MTAQTLKPGEFRAVCQKGHELETFADRDAFEAHMTGHGARKLTVGGKDPYSRRVAPLKPGQKPYAWTAPKQQKGGLEKIAAGIAAGEYRWPGLVYVFPAGDRQGLGELAAEAVSPCEHEGAHHSDDTVTVFRGGPAPETLCGFHASQIA